MEIEPGLHDHQPKPSGDAEHDPPLHAGEGRLPHRVPRHRAITAVSPMVRQKLTKEAKPIVRILYLGSNATYQIVSERLWVGNMSLRAQQEKEAGWPKFRASRPLRGRLR